MNPAAPRDAVSAWDEAQKADFLEYLDRLTTLPAFAGSARSCQLLRYLIDRKLSGSAEQVNEYAIGLDVFEKPPSFDPRAEATVRVQVSRLRKALSDYYGGAGANDPWRIELPQRAYIPVIEAHITAGAPSETPVVSIPPPQRAWRWWVLGVGLILAAVAVAAAVRLWPSGPPPIASVAVLPFANLTGDPHQDYLTDGITEQLTDSLVRVPSLRVVARTSAFQFRGKAADVREIGRRLNADAIIEGSLRTVNDSIRLTVQVNRASDGYHILSQTFDGEMKDLSRLQTQMVQPVVGALRPGAPVGVQHTPPQEAYNLYMRAWALRGTGSKPDYEEAIRLLHRAVEIDPAYGRAYAALAAVYSVGPGNYGVDTEQSASLAKAAAARALQLDPEDGEAWAAEGHVDSLLLLDWKRGESELRKAVALHVTVASNWLGGLLTFEGRFDEAVAQLKECERLDPLAGAPPATLALAYYVERRYDDSLRKLIQAQELHPDLIAYRPLIGAAWEGKGDYDKAMAEYRAAEAKAPGIALTYIAHLLAVTGKHDEARAMLAKMEHPAPDAKLANAFDIAVIHAGLGDHEECFAWLERSYEERTIWFLKVHPMLDPIRSDPRYTALLKKAGLQ